MFLPRNDVALLDGGSIPGPVHGRLLASRPMRVSCGCGQSPARAVPSRAEKPKITWAYKVWWVEGRWIATRFAQAGLDRKAWWACAGATTNEPHGAAGKGGNTENQSEGARADSRVVSETTSGGQTSRVPAPGCPSLQDAPWDQRQHGSRKSRKSRESRKPQGNGHRRGLAPCRGNRANRGNQPSFAPEKTLRTAEPMTRWAARPPVANRSANFNGSDAGKRP